MKNSPTESNDRANGSESGSSGRAIAQDSRDGHTIREHELPNGDLAVAHLWAWGTSAATVASADRPLYRLLVDVLADTRVPALMSAHLATACDDLVDARETVMSYHGGSVDLPGASYGMGYCHAVRDAIGAHRDRDPLRLAAVGCSSSKHEDDDPMPARERYKRAYWTCKRRYGETVPADWRILSAKHGILHPATPIKYYERSVDDLDGIPVDRDGRLPDGRAVRTLLDEWALRVYEGLTIWLHDVAGGVDPRDVELEVLLGRRYRDPLEARGVFEALRGPGDLTVSFPFQEVEQAAGGNGNQMDWMTDEVASVSGGEARAD